MKKKILFIFSLFIVTNMFWLINISSASATKTLKDAFGSTSILNTTGNRAGFNVTQTTIDPIVARVISVILSLLGVIFVLLMIYGGFLWMTAQGNDEKVHQASQLITAAIVGLLIVVAAYAISYFVFFRVANRLIK